MRPSFLRWFPGLALLAAICALGDWHAYSAPGLPPGPPDCGQVCQDRVGPFVAGEKGKTCFIWDDPTCASCTGNIAGGGAYLCEVLSESEASWPCQDASRIDIMTGLLVPVYTNKRYYVLEGQSPCKVYCAAADPGYEARIKTGATIDNDQTEFGIRVKWCTSPG